MARTLCIALIASMIGAFSLAVDASAHPRPPHSVRCRHHCAHPHFWRPGYYGHSRSH
ncbi:MAG TPA: hypothetical protein VN814_06990 [Caulobacteraceae bacterium]|nr:hypothetical protein [Caulobacteraceae bacterium]